MKTKGNIKQFGKNPHNTKQVYLIRFITRFLFLSLSETLRERCPPYPPPLLLAEVAVLCLYLFF